jgi:hypothetical protein
MALDHYVSQVHLKQYYSPALGALMYATKKSDLKSFRCNSESVCRIKENSTNAYLINNRAIEEFLRFVEPKYNASIAKLRDGDIDLECVRAISGFAAFVACCAPATMRIHIAPLESMIAAEVAILDRRGLLPRAPPELGDKTATELFADGTARAIIDPKYPQAVGISTFRDRVALYGNCTWEILLNNEPTCPFFTSDYPVALEARDTNLANWVVPLAPNLAIKIIPDVRLRGTTPDPSFANFSFGRRVPRRAELIEINRLIVRSAEDMVFYRDNLTWVPDFIAKNRHYRIEAVTERTQRGRGFFINSTLRIVPYLGEPRRDAGK